MHIPVEARSLRGRVGRGALAAVAAAGMLAGAPPAVRAADVAVFGGGEAQSHRQGYVYLGADVTTPLNSWLSLDGRVVPHFLTYKFRSGGELVRADVPGIDAAAGLKATFDERTYATLLAGVQLRDKELTPDPGGNTTRGVIVGPLVVGEFGTTFPSRTSLSYFGSFSGADSFIYQKVTVKQQVTNLDYARPNTINLGPELIYGRNADFNMVGAGAVVELYSLPWRLSVAARVGYRHDSTFGDGIYTGLSFYRAF